MQEPSPHAQTGPLITFGGPLAIVGGGTVDSELLRTLYAEGVHLVGADGGGDVIAAAGLVPEAIIGDLDSLSDPSAWSDETRIVRIEEQVTTDFEKTLYATSAPLTLALGMTGKRLDHTLAALNAVARHSQERWIVLIDEHDIALVVSGAFAFSIPAGERVSVHPLQPVRYARSSGLLYPLDGLVLGPAGRTGTSNAAIGGAFSIEPAEGEHGTWLLILEKGHLQELMRCLLTRPKQAVAKE